jgi:hypothetical protein
MDDCTVKWPRTTYNVASLVHESVTIQLVRARLVCFSIEPGLSQPCRSTVPRLIRCKSLLFGCRARLAWSARAAVFFFGSYERSCLVGLIELLASHAPLLSDAARPLFLHIAALALQERRIFAYGESLAQPQLLHRGSQADTLGQPTNQSELAPAGPGWRGCEEPNAP